MSTAANFCPFNVFRSKFVHILMHGVQSRLNLNATAKYHTVYQAAAIWPDASIQHISTTCLMHTNLIDLIRICTDYRCSLCEIHIISVYQLWNRHITIKSCTIRLASNISWMLASRVLLYSPWRITRTIHLMPLRGTISFTPGPQRRTGKLSWGSWDSRGLHWRSSPQRPHSHRRLPGTTHLPRARLAGGRWFPPYTLGGARLYRYIYVYTAYYNNRGDRPSICFLSLFLFLF